MKNKYKVAGTNLQRFLIQPSYFGTTLEDE